MFIVGKLKTGGMKREREREKNSLVYARESESNKNARISEVLYEEI